MPPHDCQLLLDLETRRDAQDPSYYLAIYQAESDSDDEAMRRTLRILEQICGASFTGPGRCRFPWLHHAIAFKTGRDGASQAVHLFLGDERRSQTYYRGGPMNPPAWQAGRCIANPRAPDCGGALELAALPEFTMFGSP